MEFTNVPTRCGCANSSQAKHTNCRKPVSYIYEFEDGERKYSCCLEAHQKAIISTLKLGGYVNIYKKNRNNDFLMHRNNVDCFKVFEYPIWFHGPYTLKNTLMRNIMDTANAYRDKYNRFLVNYPETQYTQMMNLHDELISQQHPSNQDTHQLMRLREVNIYLQN